MYIYFCKSLCFCMQGFLHFISDYGAQNVITNTRARAMLGCISFWELGFFVNAGVDVSGRKNLRK